MKKKFFALAMFLTLGLAGCSQSIPKEYYDEVVVERNELQKKLDESDKKLSLLQEEYDVFKAKYNEQVTSDFSLVTVQTWIDSYFSGIGTCSSYENILFVSILTGKEANKENVSLMWDEFINAYALYVTGSTLSEDLFSHEMISVTFFDVDNNCIFQVNKELTTTSDINFCINPLYVSDFYNWIAE